MPARNNNLTARERAARDLETARTLVVEDAANWNAPQLTAFTRIDGGASAYFLGPLLFTALVAGNFIFATNKFRWDAPVSVQIATFLFPVLWMFLGGWLCWCGHQPVAARGGPVQRFAANLWYVLATKPGFIPDAIRGSVWDKTANALLLTGIALCLLSGTLAALTLNVSYHPSLQEGNTTVIASINAPVATAGTA